MTKQNSYTYKLSKDQQAILTDILKSGNFRPTTVPYTLVSVKTTDCNINIYKSGKCLIQGKGAEDFVLFTMEPLVLQNAGVGYEEVLNPQAFDPHMGIDESGKGDFFGPIVIASAYVDKALVETMSTMGVKDSKAITSDLKALALGRDLRSLLGKRFSIVKIGPQAYNKLYMKMRSVNTLLSWGHARAIENLLDVIPDCPRAISDQFGKKEQVQNALMKKGQSIELIQMHKAESDMAVAAASIIAREAFLLSLKNMEKQYETKIPKGASATVKATAVDLGKKHGPTILTHIAKCHFKTTDEVLKTLNTDRSALSPEGQVKSRVSTGNFKHRSGK